MSSTATTMFAVTPSIMCWRVSSRKSRNGGPALLLTKISGCGQAASSAACPSGVPTSPRTAVTLAPVALRSSAAVASSALPSRPLTMTSQPACASAKAQPRPSPRLEAHTMALRPEIPRSMGESEFEWEDEGGQVYTFAPERCLYANALKAHPGYRAGLAGRGRAALPFLAMQPSPDPALPTAADVDAAARRLAGVALRTPLITSPVL